MGNPWYRAWVGLVSDPKIGEAALIADVSVSVVIATWHALLESASDVDDGGVFATSARRIGSVLREPTGRVEAVFAAFAELGMIRDGAIAAWEKRQPVSESNADAAGRQRKSRAEKAAKAKAAELPLGGVCHNLSQDVTAPESESETDLSPSAPRGREAEIDLAKARPLSTRDPLEAEARALMGSLPVVVDPDFSPVAALLDEPGVARGDVIAGLTEAAAAPNFRPVSWRQCAGWVRKAAKNRLAAAAEMGRAAAPPGRARAPPGRDRPQSALSVCLEIAKGAPLGDERRNFADEAGFGAGAGPVIEGRAGAL